VTEQAGSQHPSPNEAIETTVIVNNLLTEQTVITAG
jgi:hypothetical protein